MKENDLDEQALSVALCFSHWTYHITEGKMMVTDLQGTITMSATTGKYILLLTDPALHCSDTAKYRPMNLGKAGMDSYLANHKCNEFCDLLGLPHKD